MINIQKTVGNYIEELSGIARFSDKTLSAYRNDLEQFTAFLDEINIKDITRLTEKQLKRFLVYLNQKKLSPVSVSRKLSAVRGYFKYLSENELIDGNPALGLKNPKTGRKIPEVVNSDFFTHIMDKIESETKGEKTFLYKLVFELLYGGSLRVSELCGLNKSDLDLRKKTIRVLGKGNKYRIIPIGSSVSRLLADYLENYNPVNEALLITLTGRRLYPRFVHRLVKHYLSEVSDVSRKSPHILRHSSATHMLDNGADLMAVKEILGHENLSTTQIYTHVSVERLKQTFKNAHPKS